MGKMKELFMKRFEPEQDATLVWEDGDVQGDHRADSARRVPAGCVSAFYLLSPYGVGVGHWWVSLLGLDDTGYSVDTATVGLGEHDSVEAAKAAAQRYEETGELPKQPASVLDLADDEISDEARVAMSLHSHPKDPDAGDDSDEVCVTFPPGLNVHMRRRVGKGGRIERVVEVCTAGLPDDMPLVVIVDGQEERRWYG